MRTWRTIKRFEDEEDIKRFKDVEDIKRFENAEDIKKYVGALSKCIVGWGCRLCQLHQCGRVGLYKECPDFDIKQSASEAPVMRDLWGM